MSNKHKKFNLKKTLPLSVSVLIPLLFAPPVMADDTEIFFSSTTNTSATRPNILLLLDTSGSMGTKDKGATATRLAIMQTALNSIIDNAKNVNIGLARFTEPGGAVVYPVSYVDENVCTTIENCIPANQTVLARQRLKETVANFSAKSATPLVTSMFEAAKYFRSEAVDFGTTRGASNRNLKRVSHPATYIGGKLTPADGSCTDSNANSCASENISGNATYVSPINTDCQSNHLVVLSDGIANRGDNTRILNLINSNNGSDPNVSCDTNVPNAGGQCGKELASFLKSYDQSTAFKDSKVTTHTIGFAGSIANNVQATNYMKDIATAGGGLFRPANSTADLVTIFNEIISVAKDTNSSFTIPSIKVNQVNRIANSEEIYLALFKPTSRQNWSGNIKRYSLKPDSAGTLTVYDSKGQTAIDPATLTFRDTSQSFWSSKVDGNKTTLGGAAGKLTANRTIFSNLTTNSNLLNSNNAFTATNIAALDIDAADNLERDDIISWVTGTDNGGVIDIGPYAENLVPGRQQMGAPLHSEPVIISYDDTLTIPDTTLYFGTNEGYLHAINALTGSEDFAFIPKILLKNLKLLKDNTTNNTGKPVYGVDGPITVWRNDADSDKKITGDNANTDLSDDHVFLYAGLRRGGRSYFALDVTNRNSPKVLWSIDNTTPGFNKLGQSWSRPVLTDIDLSTLNINGATGVTKVIIFTAGYDPAQDTKTVRSPDTIGNGIYIVDAITGSLIWSGGIDAIDSTTAFVDMKYSIPSNIAIIDVNQDNIADLMYVGDMGGQLWRFDFNGDAAGASNSVADLVTGGVIADINDGSAAGNRRFYNPPDVALINGASGRYLTIALGSGWRAHPLDLAVVNRFYVIKDSNYKFFQTTYTKATETSLFDATLNVIGESTDKTTRDAASVALKNADGWYITMENGGEKVLSTALTFENNIIFTTYQPETIQQTSACQVSVGTGRFYFMSVVDGTPIAQLATAPLPSRANRVKTLSASALPPSAQPVFTEDDVRIMVGTEELPINITKKILKTHWRTKE
ncbi:MAG: PilC/PilY family type IV pilus protein [Gammaproteobacteria bacterium]